MSNMQTKAQEIYDRYNDHYDGDTQGCCVVIAMEIAKTIGGECVAGYIDYRYGQRSHWWVEKDGEIVDPMAQHYFAKDPYTHVEVHRDVSEFLKCYENYRQYEIGF